ncbi:MAG: iron donor protein CyaY [Rhodocyclaceae bacterium]|nr:iron donor protein CyaY [Rhodocyclaceae bacterium]MDZ4215852.1 iron donor protein CyaY [Rhodocyclaceae bacterium]
MEERDFLALADAELARMEAALDQLSNAGEVDFDFELKSGGIIEIELEDGSKIIVNRHAAAQEIWVAARAGGFHFKPPPGSTAAWTGTRDGFGLAEVLSRCMSEQAGMPVSLAW